LIMMEESIKEEQDPFRINIKQTSKGLAYYDVTVRGKDLEELQARLQSAITIAKQKCEELNDGSN